MAAETPADNRRVTVLEIRPQPLEAMLEQPIPRRPVQWRRRRTAPGPCIRATAATAPPARSTAPANLGRPGRTRTAARKASGMARPSAFARAPSKATTAPGRHTRPAPGTPAAQGPHRRRPTGCGRAPRPPATHAPRPGRAAPPARQQEEEQQQGVVCGPGRAGVDHVGKWLNKKPRAWRQAVRQAGGRPARLPENATDPRVLSTGSKAWVPAGGPNARHGMRLPRPLVADDEVHRSGHLAARRNMWCPRAPQPAVGPSAEMGMT